MPELSFDPQPRLVGELVELRPLVRDDFEALYAAARDPLIWEQHPERDRYTPEKFRRYFDGAIESRGAFVVIDRATGRIIGSSRYCGRDDANGEIEIGWTFLERAYWGGAYNGEIKALMIAHALQMFDRVVFVVGEHNTRSQKALAKIGAKLLRTTQSVAEDGSVLRKVVFAITR